MTESNSEMKAENNRLIEERFEPVDILCHWNNLPEDIKSSNSIVDFKRKLKTFLFMRAYES